MLRATEAAQAALLGAVRTQSGSKKDMEVEISSAIMPTSVELEAALIRIKREVEEQKDSLFASFEYDKVFNEKVLSALNTKDLKNAIEDYVRRYNDLLAGSTYFKRGTFDYYNASQIAKSLADNGFFDAKHTVSLNADSGNQEITNQKDLEAVIEKEKEKILTDEALRRKFDNVAKQLERNADLREFCKYVQDDAAILSRLNNPDKLKQDVLKSYLKVHENLYSDWMVKYDAAAKRRKELEAEAREQRTQWEKVIDIFNDRFVVPFKLDVKNKAEVSLGQTSIIDLGFIYVDGAETIEVEKDLLLKSLSMGERKALYVLNVIFEIETRMKSQEETLVVIDDIADSFDYQNKYAIIQYLKDISENGLFKLLIMTHNFDFFRTLNSRFIAYSKCLMASKNEGGITLAQAVGIKNVFANDWKVEFFTDAKKKIASIPFLRNIVEMTTGEADPNYSDLTAMLHWKMGSDAITVGQLDDINNSICKTDGASADPTKLICQLVAEEAEACLDAEVGMNLENKIVLAIAIRVGAERFITDRIADPEFVARIAANQTQVLIEKFKELFPDDQETITTLDQVALMTPENIHVNSFMYEPIIDMSDDHLRKLYRKVKTLQ
ncbi:MAG: phage infection protein [Planctomycetes bacterium]|nr:phage infection protein [Planctomycetota bacterium]